MSNLDNVVTRQTNEKIVGRKTDGFADHNGKYPKTDYTNQSSVNKVARGASVNNLYIKNGITGIPLEYSPVTASYYPLNQVDQSASGHIHETNDTPGSERILTKHNKGGGIDMLPDGTILICTGKGVGNRIEVVGGNYQMTVEGDGTVHYSGNMNMTVTGDYNLDVKGDYIVNVAGDQKVNILGSSRNYIAGVFEQIVQGSFSTTVLGLTTNTYLSDFVSNVKGAFTNRVEGIGNYFHKGVTKFTSETGSDFSSKNTNIFADNLTVMGDTGKIGNTETPVFCGNLFATNIFSSNIEASTGVLAPLFQGNLNGRAATAIMSEKAAARTGTLAPLVPAVIPEYNGGVTVARETGFGPNKTDNPDAGLVTQILTKSNVGYRKVSIDQDDGIKNSINQSKNTAGVSKTELTTVKLRSKLKNSNNFDNETLISECISRKILNPKYKESTPTNIGRIKNIKNTATTGSKVIGTDVAGARTKLFLPSEGSSKSKKTSLIPESKFNASNITSYKMQTKLTNRSSLAKFIAAPADGTNIKYVANQEGLKSVFRNLFPHAMIIDLFYMLDEFEGYSLNVIEGIYVLGPDEKVPPTNSIKDLGKVGRSVVYELTDIEGKIDNEKTYDLAVYLKDNSHYDTLSLYYDTIQPNSDVVHSQIAITTPVIPQDYTAFFNMKVDTYYNFKVLSNTDLIEVPDNV